MLSLNPPLFFHVMDPRVKAIHDTQKGIPNDDQWNDTQPKSRADKKRDFLAQLWFFVIQAVFTVFTFRHMDFKYGVLFAILGSINLG